MTVTLTDVAVVDDHDGDGADGDALDESPPQATARQARAMAKDRFTKIGIVGCRLAAVLG